MNVPNDASNFFKVGSSITDGSRKLPENVGQFPEVSGKLLPEDPGEQAPDRSRHQAPGISAFGERLQLLKAGSRQDRCRSRRAIACFPHVFDFEKIETHRTRLHGSKLNVYCSPFVAYDPSPDDIGTVQLKS